MTDDTLRALINDWSHEGEALTWEPGAIPHVVPPRLIEAMRVLVRRECAARLRLLQRRAPTPSEAPVHVTRYTPSLTYEGYADTPVIEMEVDADGGWVRAEDYARVAAELRALTAQKG